MLQESIGFLAIILYASIEGVTHGVLYSHKGADAFKWNEHWIYNISRGVLVLALLAKPDAIILVAGWMCFPFFHNGCYYTSREKIQPGTYPKKWWSMTAESSAKINFNVRERTTFAVAGLMLLTIYLIAFS